jgi:7-cyano-7-deazaguanine synthase
VRAVVLLSGGLDSVVASFLARQEHELALAITCDYGQRAARPECAAAGRVAAVLGVPHEVASLPWVGRVAADALTSPAAPLPHLQPDRLDSADAEQSAAAVWVPNRNGLLINVAAVYAEALGCEAIVTGFNAEEAATFADNSADYVTAANEALSYSTRTGVQVISPTQSLTKQEIVRVGRELKAPLRLVWSCYEGGPRPCLKCESCLRLKRALSV